MSTTTERGRREDKLHPQKLLKVLAEREGTENWDEALSRCLLAHRIFAVSGNNRHPTSNDMLLIG